MAAIYTSIASVRNWQGLRQLYHARLAAQARETGATCFQVYRNVHDATEVLFVVEAPDHTAAHHINEVLFEQLGALLTDSVFDDRIWERMNWEE